MMKKILSIAIISVVALRVYAVPAMPGWRTVTQPDGTSVEVQQVGDEFCHFYITRDNKELRLKADGFFEEIGNAPTEQEFRVRHAAAKARRAPQAAEVAIGSAYLPPKGVAIMVNFSDTSFMASTTKAKIDEMCNSENCTVNKYSGVNYGSIGQYFRDQSNNQYNVQFDVYGPVTLDNDYAYYGQNYPTDDGNDRYAGNVVIEACKKLNSEIDFSKYDWNNDGKVDFVYIIYAGQGEATSSDANTIWPHSYDIPSARYSGSCTYSSSQCVFDTKSINNYAISNELYGYSLAGIGIICHEFSHIMGLPDHYDVSYGNNNTNQLTPNAWDVMDLGSYNGDVHCPPNYNAWERAFFGWYDIANPGTTPQKLQMKAIGTEGYSAYQINASGRKLAINSSGVNYYIENRQKNGWDTYLPYHGMLIWKVNYSSSLWSGNAVNLSDYGDPHFTIVPSSGTKIGSGYGPQNVWPYRTFNSWEGVSGKPLLNITESNGVINLIYIKDPTYKVTWMVNGEELEMDEYNLNGTQSLALPTNAVVPCEGTEFIGWTKESEWMDPFEEPADLFTTPSGKVKADATYHAMFR